MPYMTTADGDVITASEWNTNVRDQVVTTCTSGTRPASPVKGQFIYETNTDRTYVYTGSAWLCTWATSATYTPTLVGMAIGTGGSATNTATWSFAGGILVVTGNITFGTTGTTFPAATITASLPTGFTAAPTVSSLLTVGQATFNDSGSPYHATCWLASSTTVRFLALNASATYLTAAATSTTVPFTWAAGDAIYWTVTVQGTF